MPLQTANVFSPCGETMYITSASSRLLAVDVPQRDKRVFGGVEDREQRGEQSARAQQVKLAGCSPLKKSRLRILSHIYGRPGGDMMIDQKRIHKNFNNLSRFQRYWERRGIDVSGVFRCELEARIRGHDRTVSTEAWILAGKVNIGDREWFNSLDHYAMCDANYLIINLTKKKRLSIYGGGYSPPEDKMGGPYRYRIKPKKST